MRKKTIPVLITALAFFGGMNLMCFILKATTISRITCVSLAEAISQNGLYVIGMVASFIGVIVLYQYYKRVVKASESENGTFDVQQED